jgi:prepilin-type N-terminal cleavage/methylation domain-containing protein
LNSHHERQRVQTCRTTKGFTLLEMTVVVLLLSILLGFTLPAIQDGALVESLAGTARKIAWAVKQLKHDALTRQTTHALHLDLDNGHIWAIQEDPPDETAGDQNATPWALPENMRIESVRFPDQQDTRSGEVILRFYPQGFSDRATIRLEQDNGDHTDILIETFLPFARILDEADGSGTM